MILKLEDIEPSERNELLIWMDGQRGSRTVNEFLDLLWEALQEDTGFLPEAQPELPMREIC